MNPGTTGSQGINDAGLAVGQTFTDPAGGLSITAQAISETGATIAVSYTNGSGAPTCIDGSTFAPPGPGMESCTATPVGAGGSAGPGTGGSAATGAGGQGGSPPPGGSGEAGSSGQAPSDGGPSGGCGCDTARSRSSGPFTIVVLVFVLLARRSVLARSRRRARRFR
jgi:hypothetical protein